MSPEMLLCASKTPSEVAFCNFFFSESGRKAVVNASEATTPGLRLQSSCRLCRHLRNLAASAKWRLGSVGRLILDLTGQISVTARLFARRLRIGTSVLSGRSD